MGKRRKIFVIISSILLTSLILFVLLMTYVSKTMVLLDTPSILLQNTITIRNIEVSPPRPKKNQEFTIKILFIPKVDYRGDTGISFYVPKAFIITKPTGVFERDQRNDYKSAYMKFAFLKLQKNETLLTFKSVNTGAYHIEGYLGGIIKIEFLQGKTFRG